MNVIELSGLVLSNNICEQKDNENREHALMRISSPEFAKIKCETSLSNEISCSSGYKCNCVECFYDIQRRLITHVIIKRSSCKAKNKKEQAIDFKSMKSLLL
jgi:hypothetical protein